MFPLPLVLTVRPSRRLRRVVTALHLLAGVALWLAAPPFPAQIAGSLLLAASLIAQTRAGPETTLRCLADGKLEIRANHAWLGNVRVSSKLALPYLTILQIEAGADFPRRYLPILPDSLPPEDFRRLRGWMKWLAKTAREGAVSETSRAPPAPRDPRL